MTKGSNNQMFIWGAVGLVVVAIVITIVVVLMKRRNNSGDYSPIENPMAPFASESPSTDSPIGGSDSYYTSPTPGGGASSPMGDDDVM